MARGIEPVGPEMACRFCGEGMYDVVGELDGMQIHPGTGPFQPISKYDTVVLSCSECGHAEFFIADAKSSKTVWPLARG